MPSPADSRDTRCALLAGPDAAIEDPQRTAHQHNLEGSAVSRMPQLRQDLAAAQIVLFAYYGLTREQISSRVDRPVATVKSSLRQSLAQFKECLGR